jgi:hypothetical protein
MTESISSVPAAPATSSTRDKFWWFDRETVATVLIIKVLLFWAGAQGAQIFGDIQTPDWLELWNRWDALHYLNIAENGYASSGDDRVLIVFFPLFPMLIRLASFFTAGDFLQGAFVVSTVMSVAAALLLFHLARVEYSMAVARRAVWFFLIFPTSYFLHIGYTESTFLALALGCVLAARTQHWKSAVLLAVLAGITRVNGVLLILFLLVEATLQWRQTRRWNAQWNWIALTPIGFGAYLALNYYVTGNAGTFLEIQNEHWSKSLAWPWQGLSTAWGQQVKPSPAESNIVGYQEWFFAMLGLAGVVASCWKLRASFTAWMIGNWLTCVCTTFVLSVPRYTLLMFPLMFLFARASLRWRWADTLLTVWSLIFLAIFVSCYTRNSWAF